MLGSVEVYGIVAILRTFATSAAADDDEYADDLPERRVWIIRFPAGRKAACMLQPNYRQHGFFMWEQILTSFLGAA